MNIVEELVKQLRRFEAVGMKVELIKMRQEVFDILKQDVIPMFDEATQERLKNEDFSLPKFAGIPIEVDNEQKEVFGFKLKRAN